MEEIRHDNSKETTLVWQGIRPQFGQISFTHATLVSLILLFLRWFFGVFLSFENTSGIFIAMTFMTVFLADVLFFNAHFQYL